MFPSRTTRVLTRTDPTPEAAISAADTRLTPDAASASDVASLIGLAEARVAQMIHPTLENDGIWRLGGGAFREVIRFDAAASRVRLSRAPAFTIVATLDGETFEPDADLTDSASATLPVNVRCGQKLVVTYVGGWRVTRQSDAGPASDDPLAVLPPMPPAVTEAVVQLINGAVAARSGQTAKTEQRDVLEDVGEIVTRVAEDTAAGSGRALPPDLERLLRAYRRAV